MYLKKCTKNKTLSDNVKKIKYIVSANPKLIDYVDRENFLISIDGDDVKLCPTDFNQAYEIIIEEISTRPNPMHRVEPWECENFFGEFSGALLEKIIKTRQNTTARINRVIDERAANALLRAANVPTYMLPLLLNELMLTNDSANFELREYAERLNLI